jgi:hypothetical protein
MKASMDVPAPVAPDLEVPLIEAPAGRGPDAIPPDVTGRRKPDNKLSTRSRVLVALAALALGLVYVQPLWKIALEAPQYPEGIGMQIWVNDIRGEKPNDLKNINGLNHYIGMKEIHPESIPELRVMPWIIGALMISGLLVALVGNRKLLYVWVVAFLLLAVAGMVDYYVWGYDYGHSLDPTAAIKIPGMSYQPPLIGSKQILNFVASSWPGPGGWAAAFSCGLGLIVAFTEFRHVRKERNAA